MINKMLAAAFAASVMTNLSLLSDVHKVDKRTDEVVNNINRAHLIAIYYVLKEDPTNSFSKIEEEINMKIGSNLSNRTKVLGGMTILLGAAAIISGVKDRREVKVLETDTITDAVEEVREAIETAVNDIPAGEVIDI